MLALTRKEGQSIHIDGDIVVHIVAIDECQVKVSIDAPRSVPIMRSELLEDLDES